MGRVERGHGRRIAALGVAAVLVVALSGCLKPNVEAFSRDEVRTDDLGSRRLVAEIVDRFMTIGVGPVTANPPGRAQYVHYATLPLTNAYVVIPGTDPDLADEYVVVGTDVRVDRSQMSCPHPVGDDDVCNGATEAGTGIAALLQLARDIAANPTRRSVLVAAWWSSSTAIFSSPFIDTSKIVGYVDLGILGSNLRPALRDSTYVGGADTGGSAMAAAVAAAGGRAPDLTVRPLSYRLGDHYGQQPAFRNRSIPSVYFTDTPGPCFGTVDDEPAIVDHDKLGQQTAMATALARDLGNQAVPPAFVAPAATYVTYADAVVLDEVAALLAEDPDLTPAAEQGVLATARATLADVIAAGPAAVDVNVGLRIAGAGFDLSDVARAAECDGYLG